MSGIPLGDSVIGKAEVLQRSAQTTPFPLRGNEPRPPPPGTRCPTCNRRVNKPRQTDSPDTREMRIKLPTERMESVEEAFDALQQVTGVDPYSYPRGVLLEALLVLGGQQREQIKAYMEGTE